MNCPKRNLILRALLFCSLLPASAVTVAGPADPVYAPVVEKGETEFEFRGGFRDFSGAPNERAFVFAVGYGVTDRWQTEGVLEYASEGGERGRLEALEWENLFVLTEQGQHWMDIGVLAEYEHSFSSGPDTLKIGPLLQKEIGPTVANLNFRFDREIGSGASHATEMKYSGQLKWRGNEALEWGVQGFGELGELGHLGQGASHSFGPAVFGTKRLQGRNKVRYNGAVLAGLNQAAPDVALRFQLEYELF